MLEELNNTHRTEITVGSRLFRFVTNPVYDENKQRIGTLVEWDSDEATVEREIQSVVDATLVGDLSKRIPLMARKASINVSVVASTA